MGSSRLDYFYYLFIVKIWIKNKKTKKKRQIGVTQSQAYYAFAFHSSVTLFEKPLKIIQHSCDLALLLLH